ncbi:hypothetical protein SAMN05444411_11511 [Lutibacter oricola]|uniref:Curlin associated repeat-containing protein n=1 Tax=Lutibacter oricola TaxID=762486 RepID=A0A1H3GN63_9FLAO|nr:hypothetical protein [Lutibacter oricola]SDY04557.1 hypothetical protein SAMN05444411_11511 [Lutibacter oricola]
MKKKSFKSILYLVLFGLITFQLNAQISDDNTYIINKYFQNTTSEINNTSLLNTNKSVATSSKTVNSDLNILQYGNFNYVNIKASGNKLNSSQVGNNNSYEFLTYYGRNDLNIDVQQIGNSNSVQVYGENSLINNMSIVQKSNFKTITIINH